MNESLTLDAPGSLTLAPAGTHAHGHAHAHAPSESPAATETTPPKAKKAKKAKKSALPRKAAYFILYVPDMEKAVAFYQGTLKMKLGFQSPEWSEFKAGIKFALHAWSPSSEGSCGGASACTEFKGQKTGLCFGVKDAGKSHDLLEGLGVTVSDVHQVCEDGRAFDFQDPFGNTLSIYGR